MYVLGFLSYRFISENLAEHINANMRECGEIDFDYTHLSDEEIVKDNDIQENIINQKGFFIMPSELFINVLQTHKSDTTNLNATLSNVFRNIESSSIDTKSENDFKGLFNDIDVNSSANLGERSLIKRNERLYKVMKEISKLDLDYSDNAIDAFGDAYVCLMRMYAGSAGKSGGEFFTPQEVSHLLARLVSYGKQSVNKVYDSACGSSSLLLQFAKVLGKNNVKNGFYGQEINPTSYNLCRINMILHNVGYENFDISLGDTFLEPKHEDDEPFDAMSQIPLILSNGQVILIHFL